MKTNQNRITHLVLLTFALASGLVSQVYADSLEFLWTIAPGDRDYITTGNTERGLAYNPVNKHLLVVSRTQGYRVFVLDAETGAELHQLSTEGVSGGLGGFYLNMIGVADDGAVYAGNLTVGSLTTNFKLYKWENDAPETLPTLVYDGDPGAGFGGTAVRWGDTLDVRGSGANTQVAIASRASAHIAILTWNADAQMFDANFITNAVNSAGSLGLAFGEGNTVWAKLNSQALVHSEFDLVTKAGKILHSYAVSATIPSGMTALGVDVAKKQLAGITVTTPDFVRLFDIADLTLGPITADSENLPTDNANGNAVGSVDFGPDRLLVLDTNNGIQAYKIIRSVAAEPPVIDTEPRSSTVFEGGTIQLSVAVRGTPPFSYQWRYNGENLPGQNASKLILADVQLNQAGNYSVVVTNVAGSATSADAVLTVEPTVRSKALILAWKLASGDHLWLNTDNSQRGLAYNPANGHVLVVSRTGKNAIYVLDGATGQLLHEMNVDPTIVFGGTFAINMIGVGDDGVVYACNLVLATEASRFKIYQWENDSAEAIPTEAFVGDPAGGNAQRWGDNFAVRGSGLNTQILLASRNGTIVTILTLLEGVGFVPTVLDVPAAAAGNLGNGVAFGSGDTCWGKGNGTSLLHVSFDLVNGTASILEEFPTTDVPGAVTAIAVDLQNKFLAGLAVQVPDNVHPDNVRLYDISDPASGITLVDQEFMPADNENINRTGSAAFGGGRLYVLDSNNGILALNVKRLAREIQLSNPAVAPNGAFQFTLAGEVGRAHAIEASSDLKTWSEVSSVTPTAPSSPVEIPAAAASQRFFRAALKP